MLRSSWILNDSNLYRNIAKYCILLSEVCMITTVPHSTVSPQMWCISDIKAWFTRTQIWLARFCKVNLSNAKHSAGIFFPCLINLRWLRAIMALNINVIEDDCQFLGVLMRLSTRCEIWFTLGRAVCKLFFVKSLSLSLKSHTLCSKVNWIVEYKFIVRFKL